jgi:hypothetical protein
LAIEDIQLGHDNFSRRQGCGTQVKQLLAAFIDRFIFNDCLGIDDYYSNNLSCTVFSSLEILSKWTWKKAMCASHQAHQATRGSH